MVGPLSENIAVFRSGFFIGVNMEDVSHGKGMVHPHMKIRVSESFF